MIGKDEGKSNDVDNARMETITEKRRILEDNSAQIRAHVTNCFAHLTNSLKIREKQLLRQIEAVHNHQLSIIQSNWELLPSVPPININLEDVEQLESSILKLGRIGLPDKDGIVVKDAEPYRVEEYEEANKDHVSFDKSIQQNDTEIVMNVDKKMNLLNVNDTSTDNFEESVDEIKEIRNINNCSLNSQKNAESDVNLRLDASNANLCSNDSRMELFSEENQINNTSQVLDNVVEGDKKVSDVSGKDEDEINWLRRKSTSSSKKLGSDEHPKQIQQWLQQILDETETEPIVHEIGQFAEIANSRYREFPLKT